MLRSGRPSLEDKPKARYLRRTGALLLVAGLALNVSMLIKGSEIELRLALLVLSPGLILLFSAFLVENTPSMRGCLTVFAVVLSFMAAFWAWVGVTVALDPEDKPPEILQEQTPDGEPETEQTDGDMDVGAPSDADATPEQAPESDTPAEE